MKHFNHYLLFQKFGYIYCLFALWYCTYYTDILHTYNIFKCNDALIKIYVMEVEIIVI